MDSKDDPRDDDALDALFNAARARAPQPTDDFLARLAADANAETPVAKSPVPRPAPSPLLMRLKTLFAASGLSGAAALGVWIGFIMPDLVTDVAPLTGEVVELSAYLPGADLSVLSE